MSRTLSSYGFSVCEEGKTIRVGKIWTWKCVLTILNSKSTRWHSVKAVPRQFGPQNGKENMDLRTCTSEMTVS
jgi:hypothetical protein